MSPKPVEKPGKPETPSARVEVSTQEVEVSKEVGEVSKHLKCWTQLKTWPTHCNDEDWTGQLIGLSWQQGHVAETWQWSPPPTVTYTNTGMDKKASKGNGKGGVSKGGKSKSKIKSKSKGGKVKSKSKSKSKGGKNRKAKK